MKTAKTKKEEPKVELVSYSIKMVIPTGQYANIQPEIIVKAGTVEEAHDYIAPHMNKLWKEYYMISERRTETTPVAPVAPVAPVPPPPASSVAFEKAKQAVDSCMSIEALEVITKQIGASVKLTETDKEALTKLVAVRYMDLTKK